MVDCVDYIIETSNDDFLEMIEAISRSHKEYTNSDLQHILDIEAYSCADFWKPDILYLESGELELIKKKYSTALKEDDCLNLTDSDFNFMVDPRTGRRIYESSSEEIESNCADQSIGSPAHVRDVHVKVDPYKVEDKLNESQDGECDEKSKCNYPTLNSPFSPKGNKLVFVQIPNSARNSEKIKKTDNLEKCGKPPFSYSCLIAMALKNSESGYLPVSEIYNYIIEKFPYFKTAPDGWKNSIRHNLSLNKCFQKLETPLANGTSRKACLWGLNETKVKRLNEEISKWIKTEQECSDQRELDETSSDGFGRGFLEFEENDQQRLNSPLPLMLKDIKTEKAEEIKNFHIEIAPIKETSSNESLLSDSEEQAWDDIEVDKLKPSASYFYYVNDVSQPVFDSTLSFKTVRASA